MEEQYVSGKRASEVLGVHQRTLYLWDKKGSIETIRTEGGKRLYNIKKYLENKEKNKSIKLKINNPIINEKTNIRRNIIYARVSSLQQKNDLERQIKILQEKYPTYELIKDIGSGMNFKRRGFIKIIDYAIEHKINEIVIAHKDRLCRFGYSLIKYLILKYSGGKITILGEDDKKGPKDELVEDVLQIMNIFVAKMNGLRKYKKIES